MAPKKATTAAASKVVPVADPKPKGKASKRAREEVDDDAGANAPTVPAVNENLALAEAFENFAFYEFNFGDKFAALSLLHLANTIRTKYFTKITASKDIPLNSAAEEAAVRNPNEFVGRGHRQLIDDYFKDNRLTWDKLEELKSENNTVTPLVDDAFKAAVFATEVVGTPPDKGVLDKIAAEVTNHQSFTVDVLKAMLRTNLQPVSGAKAELIRRVTEGVVMGAMGRCPHCHGGKLKYHVSTGIYSCNGFMDDDIYQFCYYKANSAERAKWQ